MSDVITMSAEPRGRAGKGAARATRRAGRIPAVIYGEKQPPLLISVEPKALMLELRKPGFSTRLFDLMVGGLPHRVLARDVQFDPVSDAPIHVDYQRIGAHATIHVAVPVVFINEDRSPGIKRGGVLNVVRHEIDLVCNADDIPHSIQIDLTGTEIGDSIHINSVTLPAGSHPAGAERDFTIASVAAPTKGKAADEAATA